MRITAETFDFESWKTKRNLETLGKRIWKRDERGRPRRIKHLGKRVVDKSKGVPETNKQSANIWEELRETTQCEVGRSANI